MPLVQVEDAVNANNGYTVSPFAPAKLKSNGNGYQNVEGKLRKGNEKSEDWNCGGNKSGS